MQGTWKCFSGTLHKKSAKGVYFKRTINLQDTYSKEGYKVKVGSKADKESDSLQTIQKMQLAVESFPQNEPLQKIFKQKLLDWMGLTPDETKEVMGFEDQMPALPPVAPPSRPRGALPGRSTTQIPSRVPQPVAA